MATDKQLSVVLGEFARAMLTDFAIADILEHLVERIVELLPVEGAGVTLISPALNPRHVAASDASALGYERLQTELREGPCITAYLSGEAVVVADLETDRRFEVFGPAAVEAGLVSIFAFPLQHVGGRLGALDLYRSSPGPLSDDDMCAARTLAAVTAAYLANAQAREKLLESSVRSRQVSVHDALTGLPNRLLLIERVDHALLRAYRSLKKTAILFADLDQFKQVNDRYGHQKGDELLVAVSRRISGLLRPGDTLARLSGAEFVILCEDLPAEAEGFGVARRVVDAGAAPFVLRGTSISISISISVGIAFATPGDGSERILQDADTAMCRATRKGGHHHQVLDLREQQVDEHSVALERDLKSAVQQNELGVEYQPIVFSDTRCIAGVEALVRWTHATIGPIPPATLIPLAEKSDLIGELGARVLEQACIDRRRWAGTTGTDAFGMCVNVSARQLMARDFVSVVADVLAKTGTTAGLLTLEVTESVFIQDAERALIVLQDLKDLGTVLSLDHFGTGYSSLGYLHRYPVDILKIDRSFTQSLAWDAASHAIVASVISLAHTLGMMVVTEGVETVTQYEAAVALGSDLCQGYYFARPMPTAAFDLLRGQQLPA